MTVIAASLALVMTSRAVEIATVSRRAHGTCAPCSREHHVQCEVETAHAARVAPLLPGNGKQGRQHCGGRHPYCNSRTDLRLGRGRHRQLAVVLAEEFAVVDVAGIV